MLAVQLVFHCRAASSEVFTSHCDYLKIIKSELPKCWPNYTKMSKLSLEKGLDLAFAMSRYRLGLGRENDSTISNLFA